MNPEYNRIRNHAELQTPEATFEHIPLQETVVSPEQARALAAATKFAIPVDTYKTPATPEREKPVSPLEQITTYGALVAKFRQDELDLAA